MDYSEFKPMLAAGRPKTWTQEQWMEHIATLLPVIVTPKIDGIRCWSRGDIAYSRSNKLIPNRFIQNYFREHANLIKPCLDGELTVGNNFQMCTSGIMSYGGEPDFTYWVFDAPSDLPYKERCDRYNEMELPERFESVPTAFIHAIEDLELFESHCLQQGFEGVILRTIDSPYKFGRSTHNQGWMLKLKRFDSAEAEVIGFEPLNHNTNEATIDEKGYQVRSSHKEGMVASDSLLGKFIVRGINNGFEGVEFNVGSGMDQCQRECFWEERQKLVGKIIEYKYQPHGVKDKPRTPIFLRFRNAEDL